MEGKAIKKSRVPKNFYDKNFIYMKGFTNISISKICDKLKYNRPTISSGNGTKEQYEKIREELEKSIAKLYLK